MESCLHSPRWLNRAAMVVEMVAAVVERVGAEPSTTTYSASDRSEAECRFTTLHFTKNYTA